MRTLAPSLLALTLAVGAAGACKNNTPSAPRATVSAPAAQTTPSAAAVEHLTVGPGSRLGFVGAKVTGSHEGSFQVFRGTVDLAPSNVEQSQVSITIQMNSVTTDQERLTNHLKSADFFDVEHFPEATFTSTSIRPGGAGNATHTVTGNLALHGQTRAITFPATIRVTPEEVAADADFTINRRDFGIVYAGMPDNLIRDEVVIRFAIRAPRGAPRPT